MEDGFDELAPLAHCPESLKNGQVNLGKVNSPASEVETPEKVELNGGSELRKSDERDSDSSSDALVIDESVKSSKLSKPNGKRLKKRTLVRNYKKSKLSTKKNNKSDSFETQSDLYEQKSFSFEHRTDSYEHKTDSYEQSDSLEYKSFACEKLDSYEDTTALRKAKSEPCADKSDSCENKSESCDDKIDSFKSSLHHKSDSYDSKSDSYKDNKESNSEETKSLHQSYYNESSSSPTGLSEDASFGFAGGDEEGSKEPWLSVPKDTGFAVSEEECDEFQYTNFDSYEHLNESKNSSLDAANRHCFKSSDLEASKCLSQDSTSQDGFKSSNLEASNVEASKDLNHEASGSTYEVTKGSSGPSIKSSTGESIGHISPSKNSYLEASNSFDTFQEQTESVEALTASKSDSDATLKKDDSSGEVAEAFSSNDIISGENKELISEENSNAINEGSERRMSNESEERQLPNANSHKVETLASTKIQNKAKPAVLRRGKKKSRNPQLQEYAQYLGLQPTVQFKCGKCKSAGFESLSSLNEHSVQCTGTEPVQEQSVSKPATTQFKIHRRVFLCSVCGTYYENWNLFLHMREVHKRFTCLYCLGMFSQPEKLCMHLISKHNCSPGQINSIEEFFNKYKDPCFLLCCECEKVFNEQDNFFDHKCSEIMSCAIDTVKNKTQTVQRETKNNKVDRKVKGKSLEEHVTGDGENLETSNCDVDNRSLSNQEETNDNVNENSNASQPNEDPDQVGEESNLSQNVSIEREIVKETELEENVSAQNEPEDNKEKLEVEEELSERESEQEGDNTNADGQGEVEEMDDKQPSFNSNSVEHEMDYGSDIGEEENEQAENEAVPPEPQEEVRKVPKLSLKLSNFTPYNSGDELENDDRQDSDGSEGLVMDNVESETEAQPSEHLSEETVDKDISEPVVSNTVQFPVAGPDIPIIELELEQPLDKFEIRALIQRCLSATVSICIYCNHARKIAVNGKQLGLHAIAEHRFSAIVNSITAEELIPDSFNSRIKDSLHELENTYFNLDSTSSEEAITFSHVFECFQCRYSTTVHKELYLHNRKMHAKTILLCIMCKSNFYSYSELICHLCPGLYALDSEVRFRCCMCVSDELPSAFRLMVHLRKRHHTCDVCLELCNNQTRLSNHVWKHKLHHFCYRCGIAYRNKPDITKHLFWKHGTESVLCKKCLQKKWPHVYHFCMPPTSFACEECNLTFTRAVSLMVHKRLHTNETPHTCSFPECTEKFVSKKLLLKHEFKHREPTEEVVENVEKVESKTQEDEDVDICTDNNEVEQEKIESEAEKPPLPPTPKVDIYDLPELNLSESDSSDSETESSQPVKNLETITTNILEEMPVLSMDVNESKTLEDNQSGDAPQILENIWDNFKNYQANKEKADILTMESEKTDILSEVLPEEKTAEELLEIINMDHDYCYGTTDTIKEVIQEEKTEVEANLDHDYCSQAGSPSKPTIEIKEEEKKKVKGDMSSDSSSDSDSSDCTCGSNCSCSSSSGSSSSSSESSGSDSSTSEGRRKKLQRKEQRKQQKVNKAKEEKAESTAKETMKEVAPPPNQLEISIQESDLETTETDTDEDFYDEHPQRLAKQLLDEKRNKLLQAATEAEHVNGSLIETSRPSTPSLPEEMKPKKKSKNKKKKKRKNSKFTSDEHHIPNIPENNIQITEQSIVPPYIFSRQSPIGSPQYNSPRESTVIPSASMVIPNNKAQTAITETDSNLRASKRRRVPNKFYGYSSDEEREKIQSPPVPKWRKLDYPPPQSPLVPPITIKAIPPPVHKPMVEPISIRPSSNPGEFRVQSLHSTIRPHQIRPFEREAPPSDSNDSSSDDDEENSVPAPPKEQQQLYCYCRCPYDEVSEMIGCDNKNCAIEWFHFECVGIMVPPKGQWYCPDCRKKKQQQRRDNLQS